MRSKIKARMCLVILCVLMLLNFTSAQNNNEFSVRNMDSLRIENEDKLYVPEEIKEDVWEYIVQNYVESEEFIKSIDPTFDSYVYNEFFTDHYYDTPNLDFLKRQSGLRIRNRINLDNPEHEKSGRTLIQIKVNNINNNQLSRGEFKYEFYQPTAVSSWKDMHPVMGKIKPKQRDEFEKRMLELGFDPYNLEYYLTNEQLRKRVYITSKGEGFMTITFDEVTAKRSWLKESWTEIELELNEVPYTEATSEEREKMEEKANKFKDNLVNKFPEIERDLTPKYNKAFLKFEEKIPFFSFFAKTGIV